VEVAKRELDEIAGESKESRDRVGNETGEAFKLAATRIKEAAKVTKEGTG
jgi:hypothetical protein